MPSFPVSKFTILPGPLRVSAEFSLLSTGPTLDGTSGSHIIREVTVNVQGEHRRGMVEITLNGFDIISGPDAVNGVGMPQIMNSGRGDSNLFDHAFEAVIDSPVGNIAAKFVGEHQSGVLPYRASHQLLLCLSDFLRPEQLHHIRSRSQGAALIVLGRRKVIFSVFLSLLVKLLVDENRAFSKVHAISHESQQLAHSGEQVDGEWKFIFAAF